MRKLDDNGIRTLLTLIRNTGDDGTYGRLDLEGFAWRLDEEGDLRFYSDECVTYVEVEVTSENVGLLMILAKEWQELGMQGRSESPLVLWSVLTLGQTTWHCRLRESERNWFSRHGVDAPLYIPTPPPSGLKRRWWQFWRGAA